MPDYIRYPLLSLLVASLVCLAIVVLGLLEYTEEHVKKKSPTHWRKIMRGVWCIVVLVCAIYVGIVWHLSFLLTGDL